MALTPLSISFLTSQTSTNDHFDQRIRNALFDKADASVETAEALVLMNFVMQHGKSPQKLVKVVNDSGLSQEKRQRFVRIVGAGHEDTKKSAS
jgi:F0F1-type ATP synthase delta subunit